MNGYKFIFCEEEFLALPDGALFCPARSLLCVSDLHLGKSERIARHGGTLLPPWEGHETLIRLARSIEATQAGHVLCLGDSFDDTEAAMNLTAVEQSLLNSLVQGRTWTWIEGNHDPGANGLPGHQMARYRVGNITFRHIAATDRPQNRHGEISGHYHPKARLSRGPARRCFLLDHRRLIMPAFGTYTGGLRSSDPVFCDLMAPGALAIFLADPPVAAPMPR